MILRVAVPGNTDRACAHQTDQITKAMEMVLRGKFRPAGALQSLLSWSAELCVYAGHSGKLPGIGNNKQQVGNISVLKVTFCLFRIG